MRCHVYRNLNLGLWSVRDPLTGLIVRHTTMVEVVDAICRVQPCGHARALQEKKRNVHAYVIGDGREPATRRRKGTWLEFTYNPFRADHFTVDGESCPLLGAALMRFDSDGAWCREPQFAIP